MLQVLFERLRAGFPDAEFGIITRDSRRLARYCEGSRPVPAEQNRAWQQARNLYTRLRRTTTTPLDSALRGRTHGLHDRLLRFKGRHSVSKSAVRQAELMVVSGGGFITDV